LQLRSGVSRLLRSRFKNQGDCVSFVATGGKTDRLVGPCPGPRRQAGYWAGDVAGGRESDRTWYERGQNDAETLFSVCDPEIEWDMSRLMPDGRIYHGHAGVRDFWRGWVGTWDDFEFSIDKVIDAGGGQVVVRVHQAGTGRGSGAAVKFDFGQVWNVQDGRIVRFRAFLDFEQALEAVGLSE
jgi:ketosteroid isomerase-like protein